MHAYMHTYCTDTYICTYMCVCVRIYIYICGLNLYALFDTLFVVGLELCPLSTVAKELKTFLSLSRKKFPEHWSKAIPVGQEMHTTYKLSVACKVWGVALT